jgi:hypothetical protein
MLGASYGGYMANWIQGHNDQFGFKAIVCHDGIFDTTSAYYETEVSVDTAVWWKLTSRKSGSRSGELARPLKLSKADCREFGGDPTQTRATFEK